MATLAELAKTYGLSAGDFSASVTSLVLYVMGIVVYALFVFKFNSVIAKRDIFSVDLHKYDYASHEFIKKTANIAGYSLLYVVVFPLIAFFSFIIIALLLAVLAQSRPVEQVMLLSMAIVGTIRVLSYYNEDLARDLAKLLPFTLMGVLLLDVSGLQVIEAARTLVRFAAGWRTLLYYFVFIISVEFVMSVAYRIASAARESGEKK